MGNSRQDVQRLFGHFGLDPADYIDSFSRVAVVPAAAATPIARAVSPDSARRAHGDMDPFDYRHFERQR
jgi:hypothetical protein